MGCRSDPLVISHMARMLQVWTRAHAWCLVMLLWGSATFVASSLSVSVSTPPAFEIPHFDKMLHFGWFSVGGFTLANAIFYHKPQLSSLWWRIVLPVVLMSILGTLDEYRQTFTPGRFGNDFGDWIADTLGGLSGVLLANMVRCFCGTRNSLTGR